MKAADTKDTTYRVIENLNIARLLLHNATLIHEKLEHVIIHLVGFVFFLRPASALVQLQTHARAASSRPKSSRCPPPSRRLRLAMDSKIGSAIFNAAAQPLPLSINGGRRCRGR